jgi:NNP family nitrate/nitrite transporter-like MFS transporter
MLGSVFGLLNVVTRPSGGMLSDWAAARWGMRGRLWALWWV